MNSPYDDELNAALVKQGWETARDYKDDCSRDEWRRELVDEEESIVTEDGSFVYSGDDWAVTLRTRDDVLEAVRKRDAAADGFLRGFEVD